MRRFLLAILILSFFSCGTSRNTDSTVPNLRGYWKVVRYELDNSLIIDENDKKLANNILSTFGITDISSEKSKEENELFYYFNLDNVLTVQVSPQVPPYQTYYRSGAAFVVDGRNNRLTVGNEHTVNQFLFNIHMPNRGVDNRLVLSFGKYSTNHKGKRESLTRDKLKLVIILDRVN